MRPRNGGEDDGLHAAACLGKAAAAITGLELDEARLQATKPNLAALLGNPEDASGGDIMYL